MYKSVYIKSFLTLALVAAAFGYIKWEMWQEQSGRMQEQSISAQKQTAPIPSTGTTERNPNGINKAGWKTYHNKELGISFSYPEKYCVGSFSKETLAELGYGNSPTSPEYMIRVGDSHITDCLAPFEPGSGNIFQITVFITQKGGTLEEWLLEQKAKHNPEERIREFRLPSITIDGTTAFRFLNGEGTPNTGAPFYNVWFQKGRFIVSIVAAVNCTAKDGSCRPPRDEQFIAHIDTIAKTIQLSQ